MRFVFTNLSALRAPFFNNSLVFKYFLASFRQRPFVSNNIVASFVLFLVCFRAPTPRLVGAHPLPSRFGGPKRSPTTVCPHQDHLYRLSQVPEFVKRKMQTGEFAMRPEVRATAVGDAA